MAAHKPFYKGPVGASMRHAAGTLRKQTPAPTLAQQTPAQSYCSRPRRAPVELVQVAALAVRVQAPAEH